MKLSFDLTWIIVLFVILKLLGVIHLSWWWIGIPAVFVLLMGLLGALLGMMGAAIALTAIKGGLKGGKWTYNYPLKKGLDK